MAGNRLPLESLTVDVSYSSTSSMEVIVFTDSMSSARSSQHLASSKLHSTHVSSSSSLLDAGIVGCELAAFSATLRCTQLRRLTDGLGVLLMRLCPAAGPRHAGLQLRPVDNRYDCILSVRLCSHNLLCIRIFVVRAKHPHPPESCCRNCSHLLRRFIHLHLPVPTSPGTHFTRFSVPQTCAYTFSTETETHYL